MPMREANPQHPYNQRDAGPNKVTVKRLKRAYPAVFPGATLKVTARASSIVISRDLQTDHTNHHEENLQDPHKEDIHLDDDGVKKENCPRFILQ